jgi:predicted glycosyltransferase
VRSILFCNETLGLGHLRRSLAIASALVEREADASALVVTGSPAFSVMRPRLGVDILKLPTLPVGADSRWTETELGTDGGLSAPAEEIRRLRSELSLAAIRAFAPDVVLVDYKPFGRDGELHQALQWCRRHLDCVIALGLWDVDDASERLRSVWTRKRLDSVRDLYDLAIVYGPNDPDDLRLDRLRGAGVPIRHTGLVAAPPAAHGPSDLDGGYLLVTTGGGVDGFELHAAVLAALRERPIGIPTVLVTGPMLSPERVACLRKSAAGLVARIEEARSDMDAVVAGARAVVAMAGYGTLAEILGAGQPALLVPRTFPREEQLNRARRWAAAGRVEMLLPSELEPSRLGEAIARLVEQGPSVPEPLTGAGDAAVLLAQAATTLRAARA